MAKKKEVTSEEVEEVSDVIEESNEPVKFIAGRAAHRLEHGSAKKLYVPDVLVEGVSYNVIDRDGDTIGCLTVSNHSVRDVRTMQTADAADSGHVSLQAFLNDWFRTIGCQDYDKFVKESGGVHPTRVTTEFKSWMKERPEEEVMANVYDITFVKRRVVNVGGG